MVWQGKFNQIADEDLDQGFQFFGVCTDETYLDLLQAGHELIKQFVLLNYHLSINYKA